MKTDLPEGYTSAVYEEGLLPEALEAEAATLLRAVFPGYPARSFFKQRPHRRWFINRGPVLAAAVAADLRHMRLGSEGLKVTGIIDLAVAEAHRRRGLGGALIAAVEAYARAARSDALILFADDHRIYRARGFRPAANPVRLLRLDDDRSVDVACRTYPEALLVKPLTARPWDERAELDLLGYLY